MRRDGRHHMMVLVEMHVISTLGSQSRQAVNDSC